MTQQELTEFNLGENLDQLMSLDPRGYGVCRILLDAARRKTGAPLSTTAARGLIEHIHEGDLVYILTGFVLLPHRKAEMDGIVSSMLLARALVRAFGAQPVLIVPEDNAKAVEALAPVVGLHFYPSIEEAREVPYSVGMEIFTKEKGRASACADAILAKGRPVVCIAIECPGANAMGEYHNAVGLNTTAIEAKSDVLFAKCQKLGVWNLAVGDLGNELGMGALARDICRSVPYTAPGECQCGCGGGILSAVAADNVLTATVSDWGVYAMIAALAWLLREPEVMHSAEMEREAVVTASRCGMLDMYGWLTPAIDGIDVDYICQLVGMMNRLVEYPLKLEKITATWSQKTIDKGFFERRGNRHANAPLPFVG